MNDIVRECYLRNVLVEVDGGEASGVIVSTGLVMTNFHVLHADSNVRVNGKEADIVFCDPEDDLLLLAVETHERPSLDLNEAQITDPVFYVGNPGTIRNVVSFGRVIARDEHYLYVDCAVQCGASGSGLYDFQGNLVGLVSAIRQPSKDDDHFGSAFGVAIPPRVIRNFLGMGMVYVAALDAYNQPHLLLETEV